MTAARRLGGLVLLAVALQVFFSALSFAAAGARGWLGGATGAAVRSGAAPPGQREPRVARNFFSLEDPEEVERRRRKAEAKLREEEEAKAAAERRPLLLGGVAVLAGVFLLSGNKEGTEKDKGKSRLSKEEQTKKRLEKIRKEQQEEKQKQEERKRQEESGGDGFPVLQLAALGGAGYVYFTGGKKSKDVETSSDKVEAPAAAKDGEPAAKEEAKAAEAQPKEEKPAEDKPAKEPKKDD
mmetsp:Transcript_49825/g.125505  ORF Transcript_49825/g.125505 Transcript_49825/m.125505 type:complete len:239 (+) Transcript_49825:100-816(+)